MRNEHKQRQKSHAGGGTTPQAAAQQGAATRGSKASEAARPNTAEGAGWTSFASRIRRTQLPNGSVLLVLENHAIPTVSVRGSLRAGLYFEPHDKPGLARLTADMLKRGTRRRSKLQIASDLESVGAEVNFLGDTFTVEITGRSLSKDLRILVETLAECLREPSFPAEELEKLKLQTVASIQEEQTNTRMRAFERLTQLTYEQSNPFHIPSAEKLIESINSITVDDVRAFYEECYGGRSLILTLAGDVQADEAQALFSEAFSAFEGTHAGEVDIPDPEAQALLRRDFVLVKEKANVDVMIGSAAPLRRNARDYYAAILANRALGESTLSSRLGLQVRDVEGLTYGISSRFRSPGLAPGPWYIGVSVNPQNVEKAVSSALGVLRDYVENGIRPDEFADEKSSAIGSFKVSLSTNAGLTRALWEAEFYNLGLDYLDSYPRFIEAVTIEDVNEAIRRYFRPDNLTVVIAGDIEAPLPTAVSTSFNPPQVR